MVRLTAPAAPRTEAQDAEAPLVRARAASAARAKAWADTQARLVRALVAWVVCPGAPPGVEDLEPQAPVAPPVDVRARVEATPTVAANSRPC